MFKRNMIYISLSLVFVVLLLTVSVFAGEVKITIWSGDSRDAWVAVHESIIESFESLHPDVDIEMVSMPAYELDPKFQTAAIASKGPDIIYTYRSYPYTWAYQGRLVPLTDLIEDIGRDTFNEAQLQYVTVEDNLFAIPLITYPHLVFYRKDWYEEKGLKVPTTWEEFYNNVKALTEDTDGDGSIDRYGFLGSEIGKSL